MLIFMDGYNYSQMKSTVSSGPVPERRIMEAADDFFREAGYRPVGRVRIRTWRPDYVAVKDDEIIIVEAKGSRADLRNALAHVAVYATDATSAYLAVPAEQADEALKTSARTLGIGLLSVEDGAKVVVKPRKGRARPGLTRRVLKSRERVHTGPSVAARRVPSVDKVLRHRRVADALLAHPTRKFTIRELATVARTPYATTWRLVQDLESLGAILSERVGPSRHLSLNHDSPLIEDLRRLRSMELSPHRAAAREFASQLKKTPRVRKVILFGSVARDQEIPSSDVDVAIVLSRRDGNLERRITASATRVQDRTRMRVVPLFVTPSELGLEGELAQDLRDGEVLYERA